MQARGTLTSPRLPIPASRWPTSCLACRRHRRLGTRQPAAAADRSLGALRSRPVACVGHSDAHRRLRYELTSRRSTPTIARRFTTPPRDRWSRSGRPASRAPDTRRTEQLRAAARRGLVGIRQDGVRGAYGIYYNRPRWRHQRALLQRPLLRPRPLLPRAGAAAPDAVDPFPASSHPSPHSRLQVPAQSRDAVPAVQSQCPARLGATRSVEAAYVGSRGKLAASPAGINQPRPSTQAPTSADPFFSDITVPRVGAPIRPTTACRREFSSATSAASR